MLLIVFICAYGVGSQAILNPYRELSWSTLEELFDGVLFLPYWQMYGELNLESIEVNQPSCPSETEACSAPDLQEIKGKHKAPFIFLAIYLLIGNVMLLNLLIAIFTSVFEEINQDSNNVWKWEMYRLVEEYDSRPGLAPPFTLIEDLFHLLKGIWKKTCRKRRENRKCDQLIWTLNFYNWQP